MVDVQHDPDSYFENLPEPGMILVPKNRWEMLSRIYWRASALCRGVLWTEADNDDPFGHLAPVLSIPSQRWADLNQAVDMFNYLDYVNIGMPNGLFPDDPNPAVMVAARAAVVEKEPEDVVLSESPAREWWIVDVEANPREELRRLIAHLTESGKQPGLFHSGLTVLVGEVQRAGANQQTYPVIDAHRIWNDYQAGRMTFAEVIRDLNDFIVPGNSSGESR